MAAADDVEGALRSMLAASPRPKNYGQVLDAASSFTALMREPGLAEQVLEGLNSPDADTSRAAVRICFEHFLNDPGGRAGSQDRIRQSQ